MKMHFEFDDTARSEYYFSVLTVVARGSGQDRAGSVAIAVDVAKVFPTAEAVDEALRFLIRIGKPAML